MDKRRLLILVVCSFASAYLLHVATRQLRLSNGIDAKSTAPAWEVPAASRSLRPNYPFSVIAGGAYSPRELQSAISRDHLVNQHYSGFDLKSARLVSLTDDRFQYVSYRVKNRIYWTRKKLRIPKGEVLITDGYNFARTRCGNRLSSQPQQETAVEQPSERILSLPPFTPGLLKQGEVTLAPAPPVDALAPGGPALPFDLPRLAPYLPIQAFGGLPSSQPSLQSYPPGLVPVFSGYPPFGPGSSPILPGSPAAPLTPSSPGVPTSPTPPGSPLVPVAPVFPASPILPSSPILPIVPIPPGTPTPPISEVPEPATLSLLALSFCGWLWLLTRVMVPAIDLNNKEELVKEGGNRSRR